MSDQTERLRGSLPRKGIDARRLTMPDENPNCGFVGVCVMAEVDPADVMELVHGREVKDEQSQYALRHGVIFERNLYDNGALRAINALQAIGELGEDDVRILALHEIDGINSRDEGLRSRAVRQAVSRTRRAIRMRAEGDPDAPNVIIQACIRLPLDDADAAIIRPDILYARSGATTYAVAEIKSFPDLAHLTDERDVKGASSQAGVYVLSLQHAMRQMGIHLPVPARAALLLRKSSGMYAKCTVQWVDRDIARARALLSRRQGILDEADALLGPGCALDDPESIDLIPTSFMGECRGFCPMWPICLAKARDRGDPKVLGRKADDLIGPIGNTSRARNLMFGRGEPPADDLEQEVQRRLQAALHELQGAVP